MLTVEEFLNSHSLATTSDISSLSFYHIIILTSNKSTI